MTEDDWLKRLLETINLLVMAGLLTELGQAELILHIEARQNAIQGLQ